MHKELEVMKPRCKGLWKRCTAIMAGMYFRIFTITPMIAKAADKKSDTTDTGVSDVTDGIDVIKRFGAWLCWWCRSYLSGMGIVGLWHSLCGS